MKKTTDLEQQLSGRIKLHSFLKENADQFISYNIKDLITPLMEEKKLTKAELARRAKMSDVYLFQVLSGRRQPSRDKLLCLSIGLELSVSQTQTLLKQCRQAPLYAKDRRDAIICYGLERGWSVSEIDDALFEAGEKMLT